jgi:probable rRNA maturation factor
MLIEYQNLEILDKKGIIPKLPFLEVKEHVLGKKYKVTLSFVESKFIQELNVKYRNKAYTPNILTFPLDETSGEIYICKKIAKSQYREFKMLYREYLLYLFIHGLLHLKGCEHNDEKALESMVQLEYDILEKYFKK